MCLLFFVVSVFDGFVRFIFMCFSLLFQRFEGHNLSAVPRIGKLNIAMFENVFQVFFNEMLNGCV